MASSDKNGTIKAFLLDADHTMHKGESAVRLMLKLEDGRTIRLYQSFEPYFLVRPREDSAEGIVQAKKGLEGLQAHSKFEEVKVKRVDETEISFRGKKLKMLKVVAFTASSVPPLRHEAGKFGFPFEYDIPYTRRYLIDKGLRPNSLYEVTHDGLEVKSMKKVEGSTESPKLRMLSLDIETYNPEGIPNAEKDPILMIGFDGLAKGVYSYRKKFSQDYVKSFDTEKQMIENFCGLLKEKKIDVICTYNGD